MRSMKGQLTLQKRNCSVGRECCFMLLLLKYQCWKSTFVRMNGWRSVMAWTCSSASTGMQPVLSLKPVNGSRNDKSQLMLLSHRENQTPSVCWQQSKAIDDYFGKNVTYLTTPPGDHRYYEVLTTVIGKLRYSTVARRQEDSGLLAWLKRFALEVSGATKDETEWSKLDTSHPWRDSSGVWALHTL